MTIKGNSFANLDGIYCVSKNGQSTYMKPNGELLVDTWFDDCQDFEQNMGVVAINNEEYIFTINGELIGNQ